MHNQLATLTRQCQKVSIKQIINILLMLGLRPVLYFLHPQVCQSPHVVCNVCWSIHWAVQQVVNIGLTYWTHTDTDTGGRGTRKLVNIAHTQSAAPLDFI